MLLIIRAIKRLEQKCLLDKFDNLSTKNDIEAIHSAEELLNPEF
ncbi:hypothetical protein [Okeania sp. SIO3I5]|nr:hypothetical protein [Okeania sp. SIO3I5]